MARKLSPSEAGRLAQETKIAKADTNRDKEGHDIGWPHYSSVTGNCMCFCKRCFGNSGCICPGCAGVNHENCHKAQKAA